MMRWALVFLICSLHAADLGDIAKEPNPERRAKLALEEAALYFEEAKADYAAGDSTKASTAFQQMQKSVELAQQSLGGTGKDPRRHAKPFKMAETATRDLLRRLDGFENSMELDDRKLIAGPKAKVQEVHDEWLNGIILGRR